MRPILLCAVAVLLAPLCRAQQPTTADQIMAQAEAQASAGHKNILVVFSASWCGPCHMFEAFLKDKQAAPIIDQYFVTVHLEVGERAGDIHHADTPGAVTLMSRLGGESAGYPFIVALDASGKPIVDSLRPEGGDTANIGYPDSPAEIDWFLQMMQRSIASLTSEQAKTLRNDLQNRARH